LVSFNPAVCPAPWELCHGAQLLVDVVVARVVFDIMSKQNHQGQHLLGDL
jgi:hypothetical protein